MRSLAPTISSDFLLPCHQIVMLCAYNGNVHSMRRPYYGSASKRGVRRDCHRQAGRGGNLQYPERQPLVHTPILQMISHSLGVTGWTDRRAEVTSDISASAGVSLISASVTGFLNGLTAFRST